MRAIIPAIALAILAFAGYMYFYLGFSEDVNVQDPAEYEFVFLQKEHTGAYHKISSVITEVESWAQDQGLRCNQTFGYYIDNPDLIEETRLKSYGGCLLNSSKSIDGLTLPEGYSIQDLAPRLYLSAQFEGSPAIGPISVYPEALKAIKKLGFTHDGPVLEVYNLLSKTEVLTQYYFPISK